jgi:hypothetical protein
MSGHSDKRALVRQAGHVCGWKRGLAASAVAAAALLLTAPSALPDHSWGTYHWARKSNPFTLKVGDNVSSAWDAYLNEAISDWSKSTVLDLTKVAGGTRSKNCRPTSGRIEVCSDRYGNNGWLGLAQIWVSGSHITQAITKVNDYYFLMAKYNKPEWRRLVMCQEIGHDFGLDHQDENFANANLGTCMDYTDKPLGPPSNEHPNAHDYDWLKTVYGHGDGGTTIAAQGQGKPSAEDGGAGPPDWGEPVAYTAHGKPRVFLKQLGPGRFLRTHVFWIEWE